MSFKVYCVRKNAYNMGCGLRPKAFVLCYTVPYLSLENNLANKFNCDLLLTTVVTVPMWSWFSDGIDLSHKTFLVLVLWFYYPTLKWHLTFSLNLYIYYAFLWFLHDIRTLRIISHCLCFSTQTHDHTHKCTSLKEDGITCYHQVTSLSYSTIALYNTDHTGVGVVHKIVSPKTQLQFSQTTMWKCWLPETSKCLQQVTADFFLIVSLNFLLSK